jgi:hypothetical protein
MSDFVTATPPSAPLDPYKRTNYTYGLVLGVDEFVQEQTYFIERDRIHNRGLHGYGTVCGLAVSVQDAGAGVGPEVIVSAGLAVNPQGQEIRVPLDQCAKLNAWLNANQAAVAARPGSKIGPLTLYVVLCYNQCNTDSVPIPGEPCRTLADSVTPSRIADDFTLAFTLDPPTQSEEEDIRAFGALLGNIEITDDPGSFLTLAQMEQAVRNLLSTVGSPPPGSPPIGSPPGGILRVHRADMSLLLHAALRVWVTEVRPALLSLNTNCASGPPTENCVLLAQLQFALSASWQVSGSVTIDQHDRPILVSTRALQEWLLRDEAVSTSVQAPAGPYAVVAAGQFGANGASVGPVYNNLQAANPSAGNYNLNFPGYVGASGAISYIVKGTVFASAAPATGATFEVVALTAATIQVRILNSAGTAINLPFMVEISAYGAI